MSLRDEVEALPIKRWTREIVDARLGPEDAAHLEAMLADPEVLVDNIWVALRKRGILVSEAAVQKWAYAVRHL